MVWPAFQAQKFSTTPSGAMLASRRRRLTAESRSAIAEAEHPAQQASRVGLGAALGKTGVVGTAHGWPRRVMVLARVATVVMRPAGPGHLLRPVGRLVRLRVGVVVSLVADARD